MTRPATALQGGLLLCLVVLPVWAGDGEPAKFVVEPLAAAANPAAPVIDPSEELSALIERLRPLQINGPHVDFSEQLMDARLNAARWRHRPRAFRKAHGFGGSRSGNSRGYSRSGPGHSRSQQAGRPNRLRGTASTKPKR